MLASSVFAESGRLGWVPVRMTVPNAVLLLDIPQPHLRPRTTDADSGRQERTLPVAKCAQHTLEIGSFRPSDVWFPLSVILGRCYNPRDTSNRWGHHPRFVFRTD